MTNEPDYLHMPPDYHAYTGYNLLCYLAEYLRRKATQCVYSDIDLISHRRLSIGVNEDILQEE